MGLGKSVGDVVNQCPVGLKELPQAIPQNSSGSYSIGIKVTPNGHHFPSLPGLLDAFYRPFHFRSKGKGAGWLIAGRI